MNKKALIFSLFLTIIAFFLVLWLIREPNFDKNKSDIGTLFFAKTAEDGLYIDKIIIKSPHFQATLYRSDKFWRVKEADDYYANLIVINTLFKSLNEAKINSIVHKEISPEMKLGSPETQTAGLSIQTFNNEGKKIDDMIIGDDYKGFYYARHADSSVPFLISGDFDLPQQLHQWLQQPLIMLSQQSVETVIMQSEIDKQLAFRPDATGEFYNEKQKPTDISALLEQFVSLGFTSVKTAENTPLKDSLPKKTIVIFMESGLIYGIEVYENEDSYWMRINLSTTSLPTKLASDYILDSSFLYKNWFFKINDSIGKFLIQYTIH